MSNSCALLVALALLALSICSAASTTARAQASDLLAAQLDAIAAPYVAAGDFSGVIAVQRDGAAPLIRPYGMASVELQVPHRDTGVFMIGSVSKQFTAVAILLLEQDGRLRTQDALSEHLPGFPHGQDITIEQLLTHTSGVADVYALPSFGETGGLTGAFEAVLGELAQTPLTHAPGAAYAYSNGGYSVLAAVIERVSGLSYGAFLEDRLFGPLGMGHTAHHSPGPAVRGRVPGYDPWGHSSVTPVPSVAPAYLTGSGSLWSSAGDLLIWSEALHTGRILDEAAYEKLVRDYGQGYGYGVSVFRRFDREVVGHDGRVAGYASDLARYLDDGVTVVVLSNVQSVARDEIRRLVAAAVFGEPYMIPPRRQYRDSSEAPLAAWTGRYAFGPGFVVSVTEAGGRLLAQANEGGHSELVPLTNTEWFSRMLYATVRFGRDETGAIDRLIWGRGDQAPVGRRIQ